MKQLVTVLALFFLALTASAQTSSVKGSVVDPSGAAVPGAACTLSRAATSTAYRSETDSGGAFVFPNVPAGTYNLSLRRDGFLTLEYKDIVVTASEMHTLGTLALQVGEVRQSVEVTANAATLQLASAEKSGLITSEQLNDIAVRGRDVLSVMSTIPGVVDTTLTREVFDARGASGITINGLRATSKNYQIDGVTVFDVGDNNGVAFEPNMDAVGEVKVLTSNYQAEFGRNSGGLMQMVIKNGTQTFHGSVYDFYRNEGLNANNFFNNRSNTPKSIYRYRITGYSIGGPVYIPKHFNRNREKLFFFFSQEFIGDKVPYGSNKVEMPTALERQGNFSQSYNVNGALIPITDPQTHAPFPGNIIPQNRFNTIGQSILNFLPLPNYVDPVPANKYQWNYYYNAVYPYPKHENIVRIDYNISPTMQLFYRFGNGTDSVNGYWGLNGSGSLNFPFGQINWQGPGWSHTAHLIKTFSPTLVNEFTWGLSSYRVTYWPVDPASIDRSKMANIPQWYANNILSPANPHMGDQNYIPNITFGSVPSNVANMSLHNNLPYSSASYIDSFQNTLSKVSGAHNLKVGIYVERVNKNHAGSHQSNYRGVFDFGRNTLNPLDSGDGYSNALLGNFNSYWESTARVPSHMRYWDVEAFVQDNWKVNKRLTLDLGVRLYHQPPTNDENYAIGVFDPTKYDPAQAPVLYRPAFNASGVRVAQDPRTGAQAAAALIDTFVPNSGNPADGWQNCGKNGYPAGCYTNTALFVAPRFGFAYDLFGDGKTAIRGGFGIFADKPTGNTTFNNNGQPPVAYKPQMNFGNLDTFTQSGGALGPSASTTTLFGNYSLPYVMSYSFSIQRQLWGTLVDVSYVGNLGRHLEVEYNLNSIPMFAHFNTANLDPTQVGKLLPDDFMRPYKDGQIVWEQFSANSNYNALQVAVNRRFAHNLQFGGAYTKSKALGIASSDSSVMSSYFSSRMYNYGPLTFDRPQVLSMNFMYDLPKVGTSLGRIGRRILDDWELSGLVTFATGAPFTPTFTTTNGQDITGSSDGPRIVATCNPVLGRSQRTFSQEFNTACFAVPPVGTFGNAAPGMLYGPGINNFDMSLGKRIQLGSSEQRYLRFRAETFNTFNPLVSGKVLC
jgi:hypothetical protein